MQDIDECPYSNTTFHRIYRAPLPATRMHTDFQFLKIRVVRKHACESVKTSTAIRVRGVVGYFERDVMRILRGVSRASHGLVYLALERCYDLMQKDGRFGSNGIKHQEANIYARAHAVLAPGVM